VYRKFYFVLFNPTKAIRLYFPNAVAPADDVVAARYYWHFRWDIWAVLINSFYEQLARDEKQTADEEEGTKAINRRSDGTSSIGGRQSSSSRYIGVRYTPPRLSSLSLDGQISSTRARGKEKTRSTKPSWRDATKAIKLLTQEYSYCGRRRYTSRLLTVLRCPAGFSEINSISRNIQKRGEIIRITPISGLCRKRRPRVCLRRH